MSIIYFPNRVYKKNDAAIDRVIAKRRPVLVRGSKDVSAAALDTVVSSGGDWQVNSLKFNFSNATPRAYSVKILGGVKVLENLNDYLWFQSPNTVGQKITLDPNFYTGDELATELAAKLNANTAFSAVGMSFTVAYAPATGLFTITVTGGTLKYIQTYYAKTLSSRDSIAGHLFGFTVNGSFAGTVVSNSAVYGLNNEAWVINEANSVVTEHYNDDLHVLSLDQALHIETNTASVAIDYEVQYEEIV